MDKKKLLVIAAVLVCVALTFAITGCSEDEDSYTDESDVTVEYLTDEYSKQLIADGAEVILASVTITQKKPDNDTVYTVHVTGKEIVVNPNYEDGYYIAETNVVEEHNVGGFAKFVYKDGDEKVFGDIAAFADVCADSPDQLYNVYILNDNVELMLLVEPEDAKVKH